MGIAAQPLITALSAEPVLGVSLANVKLLRLDRYDAAAPGNKWFKLQGNLAIARSLGLDRLVSFGGAWSNHLHALAALGNRCGLETVGIVRGEAGPAQSAMLHDAVRWGMRLVHVTRTDYRRRYDPAWQADLVRQFQPCLLIPEGGANPAGVEGCRQIGSLIRSALPGPQPVAVSVGTGATLAGIAAELGRDWSITGVAALKGAGDLATNVAAMLENTDAVADWTILDDYHCGGFARVNPRLREFMLEFEAVHDVPLEPVYTGKLLLAIHSLLDRGDWDPGAAVFAVHTGGLQGRRGYSWLTGAEPVSR